MSWAPEQIPDLSGRTAVVTGANSGLGLQTTLHLARHGARVVMACRDAARAADALARVRAEVPDADVRVASLDLGDLASVRRFAGEWSGPLDLLVDNAGVMAAPPGLTADGFETHIGVNHLGHFALTGLLLPALRLSESARVVVVASLAHTAGSIDLGSFRGGGTYRRWPAYGQSKLANLLFARHLASRLAAGNESVLVASAHPGISSTELTRHLPRAAQVAAPPVLKVVASDEVRGAWPQVYAATMPDVVADDYWGPRLAGLKGGPARARRSKAARDATTAAALWARSEELTGVRYPDLAPAPAPETP